jgi:5-methylcytosine-specific restriction enzyme A
MNAKTLNKQLGLCACDSKFRLTGDFYHLLNNFPGVLFDKNGYVRFNTREEYEGCKELTITERIHVQNGIESIERYVLFNDEQLIVYSKLNGDYENVLRLMRSYLTFSRNQTYVLEVKERFENTCAVCRTRIVVSKSKLYSEVHHIIPLNENGLDRLDNMICVCPTCHVKLDLKILKINLDEIYNPNNHTINPSYVKEYNKKVNK